MVSWLWLQLNDKQVYDLIDTLKETPIISCIYSDGEDKRYQIAESAFVLIDNRKLLKTPNSLKLLGVPLWKVKGSI